MNPGLSHDLVQLPVALLSVEHLENQHLLVVSLAPVSLPAASIEPDLVQPLGA